VISINGKVRDKLQFFSDATEDEIRRLAMKREKIKSLMEGKEVIKMIFVP